MQSNPRNYFYRCFVSLLLSYLLLWSVPSAGTVSAIREYKAPSNKSGSRSTAKPQQNPAVYRSGELLIRFRAGVPEQDKSVVVASQGARRQKQLRGESGIEKLELGPDQNAETTAQQLRLNPSVEFTEPNFLVSHDQLQPETKIPSFTGQPKRLFEPPGFSANPSLNNKPAGNE